MPNRLIDASFDEYVRQLKHHWSLIIRDEEFEPDLTEAIDRSRFEANTALENAIASFVGAETPRPSHLVRLRNKLMGAGVPEIIAAEYCVEVEAVRVASGRTAIRPLIDTKPLADPVLDAMRSALAEMTLPTPGLAPQIPGGDPADPIWRLEVSLTLDQPFDDRAVDDFVIGRLVGKEIALPVNQAQGEQIALMVFGHSDLSLDWN